MSKCYVVESWDPWDCKVTLEKAFADKEYAEDFLSKQKDKAKKDVEFGIYEVEFESKSFFEKLGERK